MVSQIDHAQSEERSCSDDYVHACHQVPFGKPEDTKPFFFWLFVVLGVPVMLIGLIIFALFRWVF